MSQVRWKRLGRQSFGCARFSDAGSLLEGLSPISQRTGFKSQAPDNLQMHLPRHPGCCARLALSPGMSDDVPDFHMLFEVSAVHCLGCINREPSEVQKVGLSVVWLYTLE